MTKMTESDIELMAIEQLEGMGYTYVYGPEIESKGSNPLRSEPYRVCRRLFI